MVLAATPASIAGPQGTALSLQSNQRDEMAADGLHEARHARKHRRNVACISMADPRQAVPFEQKVLCPYRLRGACSRKTVVAVVWVALLVFMPVTWLGPPCAGVSLVCAANVSALERSALVDLFVSTNGSTAWSNPTGWRDYSTGSDPCANSWTGVQCGAGGTSVVALDLYNQFLRGTLPHSVSLLTALTCVVCCAVSLSLPAHREASIQIARYPRAGVSLPP